MATFGRYEILDKLGEGAMGVVYRARDSALGRVVALKMLSAELGGEEELHQRFQREAEAIGRLSHPNIVTVYDMGEAEGQLYMAMELLEGDDLRYAHRAAGRHPAGRPRAHPASRSARAWPTRTRKGVVHRDIKPANILVTTSARVKILDFGLARVATRAAITRRGVILGTPDYMSPEQAMGQRRGPPQRRVLRRRRLLRVPDLREAVQGQDAARRAVPDRLRGARSRMLTLDPEVPMRLAAVVHRMLRKDPDKRYATLEDVRATCWRSTPRCAGRGRARPGRGRRAAGRATTCAAGCASTWRPAARTSRPAGWTRPSRRWRRGVALDPECDEALDVLWRAGQRLRGAACRARPRSTPETERAWPRCWPRPRPAAPRARRAGRWPSWPCMAPDDPRVAELLRGGRGRTGRDR